MESKNFMLKGDILYSDANGGLVSRKAAYLVCEAGKVAGVFDAVPERWQALPLREAPGALIVPGLVDLHLHAPQFAFRGLGMDLELLDWLNIHTFPEESKYADLDYARLAYGQFTQAMTEGGTTRAAIFATAHTPATLLLMELLEASGLITRVGRVNMDRNATPSLQEQSAGASLAETRAWLKGASGCARTLPILTPRFIPSCSDDLMRGLAALQQETGLPVQSHLSENSGEVAWVKQLCPGAETYADAYLQFGLLGGAGCPTIMAHCVYSQGREEDLMARQGVWAAHCPVSNACLSSGVAPVRSFMQKGIKVGLGTDVAGGHTISIFGVMAQAVKDSKLRWRLQDDSLSALTVAEAFYLATRGGGSFFGKVGAFEEGWEFDALVLNDANLPCPFELTSAQRLERIVYLGGDANVAEKYVAGRRVK